MRLTTDGSRNVTSSNAPDAFGVGSSTPGTSSAYLWNGGSGYRTENVSPLGLSYAYSLQKVGARYYDPALGCFLTRDTALGEKPYTYCDGDPVNFSDPSGHQKKKQPGKPATSTSGTAPSGPGSAGPGAGGGGKDGPPPPIANLSDEQRITGTVLGGAAGIIAGRFIGPWGGLAVGSATQYGTWKVERYSPVINYYLFHDGAGTDAFRGGMR